MCSTRAVRADSELHEQLFVCPMGVMTGGQIDERWSEWLDGLTIRHAGPNEAVLTGRMEGQAALYGLIAKLRDLGLPLSAVRPVREVANKRE
jgi:hypothetical protein